MTSREVATISPPPAIWGHALVRQPRPLRRLPRLIEDIDRHAAAGIPIAAEAKPGGFQHLFETLRDREGAILVEGAVMAELAEKKL
jgi:hypothetical protein